MTLFWPLPAPPSPPPPVWHFSTNVLWIPWWTTKKGSLNCDWTIVVLIKIFFNKTEKYSSSTAFWNCAFFLELHIIYYLFFQTITKLTLWCNFVSPLIIKIYLTHSNKTDLLSTIYQWIGTKLFPTLPN
jgi:hypothetical protein